MNVLVQLPSRVLINTSTCCECLGAAAFTCDDIRLLGEEAVILNELDIAAISDTDFTNCADVLGSVTDWSQAQKDALATKAKQVLLFPPLSIPPPPPPPPPYLLFLVLLIS